ncbi:AAA domain-containing protein [Streptacidiphilus sp. N1-10]|uniref:AAA domain-containing protein n=1 Tax=Streptacidiphilus jeojiensis TaxID=3229225 RepID=A0ABV6XY16_9ACTN
MAEAVAFVLRTEHPGGVRESNRHDRIGDVHPLGDGWYALPTHEVQIEPDDLTDMRLATRGGPGDSNGRSFSVMGWQVQAQRIRFQVAAHAPKVGLTLWAVRRPRGFLRKSLLDAVLQLDDKGLADQLARGVIDAVAPAGSIASGGVLQGGQAQAYLACMAPGLRLVWGPPGTGKTLVLARALADLARAGKRVLLVSATNVAVDNALEGALRDRAGLAAGQMVRVGTPVLVSVAQDPRASLPLLVRQRVQEAEQAVELVAAELAVLLADPRFGELANAEKRLEGFEQADYEQAVDRVAHGRLIDRLAREREAADSDLVEAADRLHKTRETVEQLERRWLETAPARALLAQAADWEKEIAEGEAAWQGFRAAVLNIQAALVGLDSTEQQLAQQGWRTRKQRAQVQKHREAALDQQDRAQSQLDEATTVYSGHHAALRAKIAQAGVQAYPVTAVSVQAVASALTGARRLLDGVQHEYDDRASTLEVAEHRLRTARQGDGPLDGDADLVTAAERAGLPQLAARLTAMRDACAELFARQAALEQRHERLVRELARQRAQAEPDLIRGANVVATTLTRLRLNRTVAEGPYDVVLVDEAGAALLPELAVAVAKAKETAVLFGDFCQLGPVLPAKLPQERNQARWLVQDCFETADIRTGPEAVAHQGCATLLTTHRFGPDTAELVNRITYGGLLTSARPARDRTLDPEIVVVATDGLGDDLAVARQTAGESGRWWTAGSLLAAAIAEHHRDDGESVGIITPYSLQARVTREWLSDQNVLQRTPPVEIGTAHSFQGREFDIVILDLVEDGNWPGWASHGNFTSAKDYNRNGARLLTVGATRARRRVYVLTAWLALSQAESGSALQHFAALATDPTGPSVQGVRATQLLGLPDTETSGLSPLQQEIWHAFEGHVRYTALHDEDTYFPDALDAIDQARHSIWLWSPWYTMRMWKVLPHLERARNRGVRIHLFVTDDNDSLVQGQLNNPATAADAATRLPALETVADTLVHIKQMHQKILVIDERIAFLGSLNTLSHRQGHDGLREVMVRFQGQRFARHLLDHENADLIAAPPTCPDHQTQAELRKYTMARKKSSKQSPRDPRLRYFAWACPSSDPVTKNDGSPGRQACLRKRALRAEHEQHLPKHTPL